PHVRHDRSTVRVRPCLRDRGGVRRAETCLENWGDGLVPYRVDHRLVREDRICAGGAWKTKQRRDENQNWFATPPRGGTSYWPQPEAVAHSARDTVQRRRRGVVVQGFQAAARTPPRLAICGC